MQPSIFLVNIIITLIIACWGSVILVIVGDWLYKRHRYKVKIIGENARTKSRWLKPDATGKAFSIKKGGSGRGDKAFEPKFTKDCVLYEGRPFKRPYVMVNPYAESCINFKTENVPQFSADSLMKASSEKLLSMQARVKGQTSGTTYIIGFLLVLLIVMQFLQLNALGVIRI